MRSMSLIRNQPARLITLLALVWALTASCGGPDSKTNMGGAFDVTQDDSPDAGSDNRPDADGDERSDPADAGSPDSGDMDSSDAVEDGSAEVNNTPDPRVPGLVLRASNAQGQTLSASFVVNDGEPEADLELGMGVWEVSLSVSDGDGAEIVLGEAPGAGRVGLSERALVADAPPATLVVPGEMRLLVTLDDVPGREVQADFEGRLLDDRPASGLDAAPWSVSPAGQLAGLMGEIDRAGDDLARREAWAAGRDALMAAGGLPLSQGRRRMFLFYDLIPASPADSGPFAVAGSWQGWDADTAVSMRRLGDTRWHVAEVTFEEGFGDRHQYKLIYVPSDEWFQDPHNPHAVWDGFNQRTVGAFNSELWLGPPAQDEGRMVHLRRVYSPQLDNARDVFVTLPPGYDADDRRHGVMVFHDGNESLTRADFGGELERWVRGGGTPVVGVFVHLPTQSVRLDEYTFGVPQARGDAYGDFLVETLVPLVDAEFRTLAEPSQRAILGASLGGLISYYVAYAHPGVFSRVGGMSSSFFWEDNAIMALYSADSPPIDRCYLDSGSPNDNFVVTRQMRDLLDELGYDVTYVLQEGGRHEWSLWQARLPGALDALWR